VHVLFEPGQEDWVAARVASICNAYEGSDAIFSQPSHEKSVALLNFAREIGESIGFRSSGGEGGDEDE